MTQGSSASGGNSRLALTAGAGCYLIWGVMPLAFQLLAHRGVSSWEMMAHRTFWSLPTAALFVGMARQWPQVAAVMRQPRVLAMLGLSAALIAFNWITFIWAVTHGQVLEGSLGYYINPLINMALGTLLFRERIERLGALAIALAAVGVAIQTAALGRLPIVSVSLAVSFAIYGVVRKQVAADAQTGLLIECLVLSVPGLAFLLWLQHAGQSHFLDDPGTAAWLVFSGVATAVPLMLFSWSARRIPFSLLGFLQFIAPTITFFIGLAQHEVLTPMRALSFVFIWGGAAVFLYGVWRKSRLLPVQ